MPASVLVRPSAADYPEYFGRYISLVPTGDIIDIMTAQIEALRALLEPVGEKGAGYAYAPGKWTIREVVGHLTDTERVFAYRATAFARGDAQPLPGFDQDKWMPFGKFDERKLADLLDEFSDTRRSSLALVRGMPEEALARKGVASGKEISVLSCICNIPGHVKYHLDHLQQHYGVGAGEVRA